MPITESPPHNEVHVLESRSPTGVRRWGIRQDRTIAPVTGPNTSVRPIAILRVAFGLVWAIDATLKWLPGFHDSFASMLDKAAMGQPGWLHPWFSLWTGLPHLEINMMAYATAATETIIAVGLITGFARKSIYVLGAGYTLLLWATGEGFGGPYQSGSTDIGAAIIYTFVFTALLMMARSGPDPYSLDFYLEQRIPWWYRVAEVSSHRH